MEKIQEQKTTKETCTDILKIGKTRKRDSKEAVPRRKSTGKIGSIRKTNQSYPPCREYGEDTQGI